MRLLLFDGDVSGHRETYIRRIVAALDSVADVTVAVPDELAARLGGVQAEVLELGPSRVAKEFKPLGRDLRRRVDAELAWFDRAATDARAQHALHLAGDAVLRGLVARPAGPAAVSLLMFRPRCHYARRFGSRLTIGERAVGRVFELLLARWRRRPDANAVLTLDPVAAECWAAARGAPAIWLPEPPVLLTPRVLSPADRDGSALVGSLAHRKGLHLLAADGAVPAGSRLVLVGRIAAGYEAELRGHLSRLEANGVSVDLRTDEPSEQDLLDALGAARCAVLPYPRHFGMSRVLVEAAVAGTPVVVNDFGLMGHLVRRHGLGATVDCTVPRALSEATLRYLDDPAAVERHEQDLSRFAARFSAEAFSSALRRAFGGRPA